MRIKWLLLLCLLCPLPTVLWAGTEFCLTGNGERKALNKRLHLAGYRYVWVGTNQPVFPGERHTAGWLSFAEGMLCDGADFALPFQSQLRDKCKYTGYAWPRSKKGVELEIDLGQVCAVTRFALDGSRRAIVKGYSTEAKRWLPLADGESELKIAGFQCRRFRAENEGDFAEMYIWGRTLGEDAIEKLPPPVLPSYPDQKFVGLNLKPSDVPAMAPDPFVYPQPQEMSFGGELVTLPRECPLVLPKDASDSVRQIAETLANQVKSLVRLDFTITDEAQGPAVWLGLGSDEGVWSEVGKRRELGAEQIREQGYAVEVTPAGVVLVGRDERGLYYATRTFLFLMRPRKAGVAMPIGYVRDFPRGEIRPAFAFQGWSTPFKRRLAIALATLKYNVLQGGDPQRDIMQQNHLDYIIAGQLFPASRCGAAGDLLERLPGYSKKALNPARLSACCSHPDFWQGMFRAWERLMEGWKGNLIDIGYDEIFHNPYNVCARCRSRGLTAREMLLDCYMKAYRHFREHGFGIHAYATGFGRRKAFDMYLDVPTDSVLTNYLRDKQNSELKARGIKVIGGSTGPVRIDADSPLHAGIVWNWGSEHPAAMWGEGKIRSQVIIAEQNWSLAGKTEWKSPEWQARLNRALEFTKHMVNVVPLPIPGVKHKYFTIGIAAKANRSLKDEVYGDGTGWLDEGPTGDLRHFPTGKQTLDGIPYDIPTGDRVAIMVAGPESADSFLPDQIAGIEVGRKAGELFFLHTCSHAVWTSLGRRVMLIGFYRIRYDDGTFVTTEVNYGQHIREWTRKYGYREMTVEPTLQPLPDARVAWRGGTDGGHDVTLYAMPWRNPYPEKPIAAIDMLASAQAESNRNRWALLAVSGREVTEGDVRASAFIPERPALRTYRPRPGLPSDVERLDLTRRTPPPFPVPVARVTEWETNDKWFKAKLRALTDAGATLAYEKSETNRGPYGALDPDDDPWRCGGPSAIVISFKRLIPLGAIGVKGILQRIRYPEIHPVSLEVIVFDQDREPVEVGKVSDHVGQEGEQRWVLDPPIAAAGVEVRVTSGPGLSAIHLYAKKGAVKPARFKATKMGKKDIAIGDEVGAPEDVTDEDVIDEFEGID